ncbi:hypothetical protein SAMN05421664_0083 [Chryseobacterium soldanellicola]|uniref:Addiction module component n=1 Tax=Chryseobacterium soldanellicola TaxID=311333 RepID=A0A1H0XND4_9FLAO|nr:hypothetical protein [Chryseobacterium soldanellicola]SDQ04329.1 hypothetical protein SAMN05421664_0083 [Chryseobacterium soldanellicola]
MSSNTLHIINQKLKGEPEEILKQVLGYLDGILENKSEKDWYEHNLNYQLTDEQKRELDTMENLTDGDFMPAEEFHKRIKEKYGF